jgi:type II secretory pathway pseudopilin PulG
VIVVMCNLRPEIDPSSSRRRQGFTLLEVLVACGILVVSLASIAAILPAAGSMLAEANAQARASSLAANAFSELRSRRLLAADVFVPGTSSARMGRLLDAATEDLDNDGVLDGGEDTNGNGLLDAPPSPANLTVVDGRVDRVRTFQLEDDVVYSLSGTSGLPGNSFVKNGSAGVREYRDGVCWGAMLVSDSVSPPIGTLALLSVAVFKKAPSSFIVNLYSPGATPPADRRMLALFEGDVQASPVPGTIARRIQDESTRKRLLTPGAAILVVPRAANDRHRWVRVTSSWTTNEPTSTTGEAAPVRKSFVMLESAPQAGWSAGPGGTALITAICFENLMRLEEQWVTLQ